MPNKIYKLKRIVPALLISTSLLTACGGGSTSTYDSAAGVANMDYTSDFDSGYSYDPEISYDTAMNVDTKTVSENAAKTESNQKLIRTVHITLKAKDGSDVPNMVEDIVNATKQSGGYIEYNSSSFGDSNYASITGKVPKDKADSFLENVKGKYELLSIEDSSEDVTLQYTDIASRLKVKEESREKYMSYLEKAENVQDLMDIETRLNDVIADIESYKSQLNILDSQIDYTTIYITLRTQSGSYSQPFSEKFSERFKEIINNAQDMILDGIEWFVGAIIVLIFGLPILYIVLKFFIWALGKRKKDDRPEKKKEKNKESIISKIFNRKKKKETENTEKENIETTETETKEDIKQ